VVVLVDLQLEALLQLEEALVQTGLRPEALEFIVKPDKVLVEVLLLLDGLVMVARVVEPYVAVVEVETRVPPLRFKVTV
jgi:hypothetical protein